MPWADNFPVGKQAGGWVSDITVYAVLLGKPSASHLEFDFAASYIVPNLSLV